jgi:hypothetical protein
MLISSSKRKPIFAQGAALIFGDVVIEGVWSIEPRDVTGITTRAR